MKRKQETYFWGLSEAIQKTFYYYYYYYYYHYHYYYPACHHK